MWRCWLATISLNKKQNDVCTHWLTTCTVAPGLTETTHSPMYVCMAWHGMAWHDMTWHGKAGPDTAWHGMAWHQRNETQWDKLRNKMNASSSSGLKFTTHLNFLQSSPFLPSLSITFALTPSELRLSISSHVITSHCTSPQITSIHSHCNSSNFTSTQWPQLNLFQPNSPQLNSPRLIGGWLASTRTTRCLYHRYLMRACSM